MGQFNAIEAVEIQANAAVLEDAGNDAKFDAIEDDYLYAMQEAADVGLLRRTRHQTRRSRAYLDC